MLAHDFPFSGAEILGFEQNGIGDTEFAHIVEQTAAPDMLEGLFTQPGQAREAYRQIGHPLGMAFGLFIAQIQGS